jgi:4'-phosphopantetheinyl transferase
VFFLLRIQLPGSITIDLMRIRFAHIDDGPRRLEPDEVHIWSAPLDRTCDPALLIESERERAARFKMERIRNQFIAARAQLRIILSRYVETSPCEVPIVYERNGKPILSSPADCGLHFNVSHSESLAVFAVTRSGRVGIDVERRRPIPNIEALVERFFTRRERDTFFALAERERLDAFLRAWTRKEAVLKAIGSGVQALDQCEVTFCAGEDERVLRVGDDMDAGAKWLLRSWQPAAEYDAALAVELPALGIVNQR